MPPKRAITNAERNKRRDRRLTREEWLVQRKPTLRQRCAIYGLSIVGKKEALADRLIEYLQVRGQDPEQTLPPSSSHSSVSENEDIESNISAISATVYCQPESSIQRPVIPPTSGQPIIQMPLDDLRALIREEVQLQNNSSSQLRSTNFAAQPEINNPPPIFQLSPASFQLADNPGVPNTSAAHVQPLPHASNLDPLTSMPMDSNQGNNFSLSDLPPLSINILKAIQNKDYINFNTLLPSLLYDYNINQTTFNFQINPNELGNNTVALTSSGNKKVKINSIASWMQAWNLYIRAMVFYHPRLAPELLMYQEYICGLQRSYPLTSWLRYDAAFRLSISQQKSDPNISWSKINDYAFNQFIRCSPPQAISFQKQQCFKCSEEGHYANNCPNAPFRPSSYQQQQRPFQQEQSFRPFQQSFTIPCRHFNNNNQCKNPQCSWPHRCNRCGGDHSGSSCRHPRTAIQPFTSQKPNSA